MKEDGIKVVLANPNIATIQTDTKFVDKVYSVPLNTEFLEKILEKERPDGILLGFGGQTALNLGMELYEKGILDRYSVKVFGTGIDAIETCDNREKFRSMMVRNDIPVPKSKKANSIDEALSAAEEIGYPVIVRVAYTLGGQGSGIARDYKELIEIASKGLAQSRINQVLVEEYLDKWKEIEYEVMRDGEGNCTIVCNMENFDPLGIHTGESIVVAPSQTLTNREYHALRMIAFKAINALEIVGECNIQFAVHPEKEEYLVIEVNSRLSRSSALASKATGYPIAYTAAKLSIGYMLPELTNKVTGMTTAFFEPALDYVTIKIPRWDFQKFKNVSWRIDTQMKSVGEVMAIGRTFEEAMQKAVRMLDIGKELTDVDSMKNDIKKIEYEIEYPTDKRIFYIVKALQLGVAIDEINKLSGIDKWFLHKIKNIVDLENKLKSQSMTSEMMKKLKQFGFSDARIGKLVQKSENEIRRLRKSYGIVPVVKQIDTLSAEWPAVTNYLYLTYNGDSDDLIFEKRNKIIVLGSGCYKIGSSVEFDWCCVNMAWALKNRNVDEIIMINYNPETVSTDYDISDKLYFEEITLETVLDIIEKENASGVVVSVGGQIPNNLALKLAANAVTILGTSAENVDRAEDRAKFSAILDELKIPQPRWSKLDTLENAKKFANEIGYPVMIRPSYVLAGSKMQLANDENELEKRLKIEINISHDHPVVMSKFLTEAQEVEVDAVSDGSNVFIGSILEHLEEAGVHSGDATISIPTITISEDIKSEIRDYTRKIAKALNIKGPFNIQYMVKSGDVYVIECNLRASRSVPFVSKTVGVNLMDLSADVFLGSSVEDGEAVPNIFAVKFPQFSFMRLKGADPVTSVDMVSTGEVACFGKSFKEAFLKSLIASGFKLPKKTILLSTGSPKTKNYLLESVRKLAGMGFDLYATQGTAKFLEEHGIKISVLHWPLDAKEPNTSAYISSGKIDLVINIPKSYEEKELTNDYLIRRKAVEFGIPIITNAELVKILTDALAQPMELGLE